MKSSLLFISLLTIITATGLTSTAAEAKKPKINVDIFVNPTPAPYYGYEDEYDSGYDNEYRPRWHRDNYNDNYNDYDNNRRNYIGEVVLGSTRLSYGRDMDVVDVSSCRNGMAVSRVKVRVSKNNAYIDNISITLANGREMYLPVRNNFAVGSSSRWIDLRGLRCIRSFQVFGSTDGLPVTRARVKLIGDAYSVR